MSPFTAKDYCNMWLRIVSFVVQLILFSFFSVLAMRHKHAVDGGPFIMPDHPGPKISRDRSFRSEEVLSGIRPSIHRSVIEGMEVLERIIINSHPESCEQDQEGSTKTDKSDSGRKADGQKPNDMSIPHDDFVLMKTTDTGSANLAVSDALPVSANVLKETPRSTVKPLKGARSRSAVKKRSISLSFSKEKEEGTVNKEKEVKDVVPSTDSKSKGGQRTPIQSKTPVTPSVQEVITHTLKSAVKESSDMVLRNSADSHEASPPVLHGSHLRPGMLNVYLLESLEYDQLIA
jgi:hypothetical protein